MISDLTAYDDQGGGFRHIDHLDSLGNSTSFTNDLDLLPVEQFSERKSPEKGNKTNLLYIMHSLKEIIDYQQEVFS